jgi:hypothetical protein
VRFQLRFVFISYSDKILTLIAFLLDIPYFGSVRTPDYAVSVGESKPAIVVEVGISQHFEDLEERARMWVVGRQIQLVILVDIQVCKANTPREESTSSIKETSILKRPCHTDSK